MPVGRKFIAKQPALTKATMERMQGAMQELMPAIRTEVEKAVEEARERQAGE